jgi:glycosyltransferase involved in cell wall biosynthesis
MKLLIFMLSYNAEQHIRSVFDDIPVSFRNNPFTELLLIDDASQDSTVAIALTHTAQIELTNVRVMKNARNQGYGGSQKVGYKGTVKFFLQKYHLFDDVRFHPEVVFENWTDESGPAAYEWISLLSASSLHFATKFRLSAES